jgi:hypothetical protein
MTFSYLPAFLTSAFSDLAHWLDKRTAVRLPLLLGGILFARGRRTVTSWFRAAGIEDDYRQGYVTVWAVGRQATHMAISVVHVVTELSKSAEIIIPAIPEAPQPPPTAQQRVEPEVAGGLTSTAVKSKRLVMGIDDTPTQRYGPCVEGAGIHHHPSPGPAGEKRLYGHIWVTLAALAKHPNWGTIALPVQAQVYIRQVDVAKLPPDRPRPFKTKLVLAVEQLNWLDPWVAHHFDERWVVVDGGYAKKPFLLPAKKKGWTVISRLRKDAHLCELPPSKRKPGQRGRTPIYGKKRIHLAELAAQEESWQQVECEQYGAKVSKTIKTFLATWRPAGGEIRVVLVKEDSGWVAFFSTSAKVTAIEILEAMADRGSLEQTNKDVKDIWGADEQQVRNLDSNVGCFNLNLWMYTLVEAWAWDKPEEELIDREPWDREPRRPSHADKRRALQREILKAEIEAVLSRGPSSEEIQELVERLLDMAA